VIEVLAIFSVLLAGWGLFGRSSSPADEAPEASSPVAHERGAAARRLLG
jgi:hypothetical protein